MLVPCPFLALPFCALGGPAVLSGVDGSGQLCVAETEHELVSCCSPHVTPACALHRSRSTLAQLLPRWQSR